MFFPRPCGSILICDPVPSPWSPLSLCPPPSNIISYQSAFHTVFREILSESRSGGVNSLFKFFRRCQGKKMLNSPSLIENRVFSFICHHFLF